ncbi:hypothetical protein AOC10_01625 [Polynucleobacter asymbioticus]|uniref:O-antigen ligase family protein n=1 Tax=Polynucleobacter asymbioticus TaxID=576611 RepID=UPI0008FB52E8|nr:O-antigen ligase family protein [Polynucleobacter asymbioticus]APC05317.1 hypothetical protein AOC10_01625 [Polynucleobacter asymbioticus]
MKPTATDHFISDWTTVYRDSYLRYSCEWLILLCASVLLVIWPLTDTIALRNISLGLGAASSLAWFLVVRPKLNLSTLLPVAFLLGVPVWLWLHLQFLPVDRLLQIQDLSGTWLRVLLVLLMASGLGCVIALKPSYLKIIGLALLVLPIINLILYIGLPAENRYWMFEYKGVFKSKIAGAYFLLWPLMLSFGVLQANLLVAGHTEKRRTWLAASLAVLTMLICIIDMIAIKSLNALLIAALMTVIFFMIYFWHQLRSATKHSLLKRVGAIALLIAVASVFSIFWQYDQQHEKKLSYLAKDVQIATHIDRYETWHGNVIDRGNPEYYPMDEDGRRINGSAYERTSWFLKGLQFLKENPWGTGYSHLAFGSYMAKAYPGSVVLQSHSGWLDFALGVGLPGLLLVWLAMGFALKSAWRNINNNANYKVLPLATMWMLVAAYLFWWIGEISEREFLEHFFFMVAFLGVANGLSSSQIPQPNKSVS